MNRRCLPALALSLALLLSASDVRAVVGQVATPAPLFASGEADLAAMAVTPADLDAIGLPGFGRFGNGFFLPHERSIAVDAGLLGLPEDEVRDWYGRIGYRQAYGTELGLPSESSDDQSPPARGAFSRINEFADAAGAAEYLASRKTAVPAPDSEMTIVAAPFAIGVGAAIVDESFLDPGSGGEFYNSYVVFQSANLFISAGFFRPAAERAPAAATPADGTPEPRAATLAELESLARRQVARIEAFRRDGAPDLPNLVLRVGESPPEVTAFYSEGYRLLDGEIPPYYGGFEDDILADPAATAGAVAAYELEEKFQYGDEPAPGDPYLLIRLYQFPEEDAASAFVAGRSEALANGGFQLATGAAPGSGSDLLPGVATDLGDESLAFLFVRQFIDDRATGYEIYVRVGDVVAAVSIEGPPGMPIDTTAEIAAAQTACLEAGSCSGALPVPTALRTMLPATPSSATPAP